MFCRVDNLNSNFYEECRGGGESKAQFCIITVWSLFFNVGVTMLFLIWRKNILYSINFSLEVMDMVLQ